MSIVHFTEWNSERDMQSRFRKLLNRSNILSFAKKDDFVAIKTHVGEYGNLNYVHPVFVRAIVDALKGVGAKPFVTDTTSYYNYKRHNAIDHIETAYVNGFSYAAIGAPFIVSDGLGFQKGIKVQTKGALSEIELAPIYEEVDKVIVLSHCKGHPQTGFGGAIKNIGMGCTTKAGKLAQHRAVKMEYKIENCDGCGKCISACEPKIPIIRDGKRRISEEKEEDCMHCGFCVSECAKGVISMTDTDMLPKALASACYGFLSLVGKENVRYISFANNISMWCDCCSAPKKRILDDIGILAAEDIVAIDKAFLDLAHQKEKDVFEKHNDINPMIQVNEAERLGLGSSLYELVK